MVSSQGRPNLTLAICCMSLFIVGIDVTIVNVAFLQFSTICTPPSAVFNGRSTPTPSSLRAS